MTTRKPSPATVAAEIRDLLRDGVAPFSRFAQIY
jgi:hypothetical protein